MQQKVSDKLSLTSCYRIDKQFLMCVDDIFKKADSNVVYSINIWCKNIKYSFVDLAEFFDFSSTLASRIFKLQFDAHFPIAKSNYITNDISIMFSNKEDEITAGEITFDFNDERNYLVLKNQIETLLKNYKLNYSVFSYTAIIPLLDIVSMVGLFIYTGIKNIVFAKSVQNTIWVLFFILLLISILPPIRRLKRFIFPRNEFSFGVNVILESRARSIRTTLGTTILLGIVIGILVNIITNFII